jgi:hypothetical protein
MWSVITSLASSFAYVLVYENADSLHEYLYVNVAYIVHAFARTILCSVCNYFN